MFCKNYLNNKCRVMWSNTHTRESSNNLKLNLTIYFAFLVQSVIFIGFYKLSEQ